MNNGNQPTDYYLFLSMCVRCFYAHIQLDFSLHLFGLFVPNMDKKVVVFVPL